MDEAVISESHSTLPSLAEPRLSSEQSSDVNSSENAMPNISIKSVDPSNDPSSTEQLPAGADATSCNTLLDQVSSTSETYLGAIKHNLPSINHQSVLIPNMEPYLEEGSLDGSPKDDPTSSNSTSIAAKADINSSNGPSSTDFIPLNLLEDVCNPTVSQENIAEENTIGLETTGQAGLDPSYKKEPLTKEANQIFNDADESTVTCPTQTDAKPTETDIEPAPEVPSESHFVSDAASGSTPNQIYLLESSYQPNLEEHPLISPNPVAAKCETLKEESETVVLPLKENEIVPPQVDNVIQKMCDPVSELNAGTQKEELTESEKEIHLKSAECTISDLLVKESCAANSQLFTEQSDNLKTPVDNYTFSCNEELKEDQSDNLQTPVNNYTFSCNEELKEDSTISSVNQHLETAKVEDCNQTGEKTQTEYMQYGQSEETNSQQEVQATNASICEADSSAVGLNGSVFSGEEVAMGSQSVYVVDDGMALNSIPQSGSMTPYQNSENAMLVEMAPLSTDGSYVNSHTQVHSILMMID